MPFQPLPHDAMNNSTRRPWLERGCGKTFRTLVMFVGGGAGRCFRVLLHSACPRASQGLKSCYGVEVIHNATTQKTAVCVSWGVTVPIAYVNRARRFGFEGDPTSEPPPSTPRALNMYRAYGGAAAPQAICRLCLLPLRLP